MARITLNCQHADTCLPDYWSGHHLAHICVPVWQTMTIGQLRNALRDELKQGAVAGNDDIARMLSADFVKPEEEAYADAVTRAAYAAINRDVRMKRSGARYPFRDIANDDEDEPAVYAYFVFRQEA